MLHFSHFSQNTCDEDSNDEYECYLRTVKVSLLYDEWSFYKEKLFFSYQVTRNFLMTCICEKLYTFIIHRNIIILLYKMKSLIDLISDAGTVVISPYKMNPGYSRPGPIGGASSSVAGAVASSIATTSEVASPIRALTSTSSPGIT